MSGGQKMGTGTRSARVGNVNEMSSQLSAGEVGLTLAVLTLAVARVTGLVVSDSITEPLRDRLLVWLDDRPATAGSWVATLITCPWCAGMWVSLAAAPLAIWLLGLSWLLVLPLALAFSQVTGMIAGIGR